MSIKEAILFLLKNIISAALATMLGLLVLEWLMPKSVLAFFDVFDWLLPTLLLWIFLYGFFQHEYKNKVIFYIQIITVSLIGLLLLVLLLIYVPSYGSRNLMLLGASGAILGIWLYANLTSKDT